MQNCLMTKRCSRCKADKPLSDFYPHAKRKDGLNDWCKDCFRERRKQRYAAHRDEEKQYSDTYRKQHADSCNATTHRYRERIRNAEGRHTQRELEKCLKFFDYKCAYSGLPLGDNYQFDHVVPVSKGGDNTIFNLVPCLPNINLSKGAKDFETWYNEQEFYSAQRHYKIKEWIS